MTRQVTNTEFTSLPVTQTTYSDPESRVVESFYDLLYRRNVVSDAGGKHIADWRFYRPSRIADFTFGSWMESEQLFLPFGSGRTRAALSRLQSATHVHHQPSIGKGDKRCQHS